MVLLLIGQKFQLWYGTTVLYPSMLHVLGNPKDDNLYIYGTDTADSHPFLSNLQLMTLLKVGRA